MRTDAAGRTHVSTNRLIAWSIGFGLVLLVAISMVSASGTPDPTEASDPTMTTSVVNSAVIVFREGLEAVLIFAAITASFLGKRQRYRRPVVLGVAAAFVATVMTWFVMQAVLGFFGAYGDVLQAVTGLVAIAVLLVVMNWFFHKVYWTDHIAKRNARKRALVADSEAEGSEVQFWGFVALGFSAVYREGFEVVLFLQNLQLKAGTTAVLWGVALGLAATAVVGFITFFLHHKLPYKRMLALTGVLLGGVLVVMVGGTARTLQDLGWITTTPLGVAFPDWWARWLEVVPTVETLLLQLLAASVVVGSYYAAERMAQRRRDAAAVTQAQVERHADAARPAVRPAPAHVGGGGAIAADTSPAAARGAVYAAQPEALPRTLCHAPATTLCGASAVVAVAADPAAPPPHGWATKPGSRLVLGAPEVPRIRLDAVTLRLKPPVQSTAASHAAQPVSPQRPSADPPRSSAASAPGSRPARAAVPRPQGIAPAFYRGLDTGGARLDRRPAPIAPAEGQAVGAILPITTFLAAVSRSR